MSITLITGVPGGGKTYLAVNHLLQKYYKWDGKEHTWVKKEKVTIIANIESLELEHESFEELMEKKLADVRETKLKDENIEDKEKIREIDFMLKKEQVKYFFDMKYQEYLKEKYGSIIYVIDECQRYFDLTFHRNKWARDVYYFFEMHRHLGMDIFLITQNSRKLPTDIRVLAEKEFRALPRSLNLLGELKYNEYINGMKANTVPKVIRPNKKIFKLYQSMTGKETEKIKSPLRRFAIFAAIAFVIGSFVLYKNIFKKYRHAPVQKIVQQKSEKTVRPEQNALTLGERQSVNIYANGRWVKVSYAMVGKDINTLKIYDPIARELVPYNMSRYKMKIHKNEIYCLLSARELEAVDESRRSEAQAESPAWIGSREEEQGYVVKAEF